MKIGLSYMTQIRGGEETPPVAGGLTTTGTRLDRTTDRVRGWIALTFNQLVAAITSGYHTEHNSDDTHATIHATGSISERGRTIAMGEWIAVPHDATYYTASVGGGTWTVTAANQVTLAYCLIGNTMILAFTLETTSVSATPAVLFLKIPAGYLAVRDTWSKVSVVVGAGPPESGVAYVSRNSVTDRVELQRDNFTATNWAISVNTTSIRGTIAFEVRRP